MSDLDRLNEILGKAIEDGEISYAEALDIFSQAEDEERSKEENP